MEEEVYKVYDELCEITKELLPYYDIDKVKFYSVYVWNKMDDLDLAENLFDIEPNEVVYYNKEHKIVAEALPIIEKIQCKLRELELIR